MIGAVLLAAAAACDAGSDAAKPAPAPPSTPEPRHLEVRSEPAGAAVRDLDTGKLLGETPQRVDVPERGERTLEVALEGHVAQRLTVDAGTSGALTLQLQAGSVVLRPDGEAAASAAPKKKRKKKDKKRRRQERRPFNDDLPFGDTLN